MQHNNKNTEKNVLTDKIIESLPKVELHRHLEGSFRLETLIEFAKKRNMTELPLNDPESFRQFVQMTSNDTPDFLTFLSKFRADWYSTLKDPERLSYESVEDAAKENIIYYEMRFSPEHFTRNSGFSIESVIESIITGANNAANKFDIKVAYIITMGREKLTPDEMIDYIKICSKYKDDGIVGIDLAGDEIHYPPELFKKTFKGLYEKTGFYATIHAGEASGAHNIVTSINDLDASRIGHGVKAIEDESVQELLIEKNVALEQCITSNIQTATVSSFEEHPFNKFYQKGVKVTLNTDDPQIQQSDLNDDYKIVHKLFSFGLQDFKKVNINSLEAAFQSKEIINKLIEKYNSLFPTE